MRWRPNGRVGMTRSWALEHRSNLLQFALTCEWIAQHSLQQRLAVQLGFRKPKLLIEQGLVNAITPVQSRFSSQGAVLEAQ